MDIPSLNLFLVIKNNLIEPFWLVEQVRIWLDLIRCCEKRLRTARCNRAIVQHGWSKPKKIGKPKKARHCIWRDLHWWRSIASIDLSINALRVNHSWTVVESCPTRFSLRLCVGFLSLHWMIWYRFFICTPGCDHCFQRHHQHKLRKD